MFIIVAILVLILFLIFKTGNKDGNNHLYAEVISPVEYKRFKDVGVYDPVENPGHNGPPEYNLANRRFHGSTIYM